MPALPEACDILLVQDNSLEVELTQTQRYSGRVGYDLLVRVKSSAPAGYLTAVVASQVASPIVWSHYALILLLPVAWLIEQRQWWAAAIPFALTWVLLAVMPIEIYPLVFYVTLIGVPVVDWRQRTRAERQVLAAA